MITEVIKAESDGAAEKAAEVLKNGGLVAFPTETVYGLAADAMNPDAVRHLYEVKGRPESKAFSLCIDGESALETYGRNAPPEAYALARRFWPGPLTIIVNRSEKVSSEVTGGKATVGLRCPANETALAVVRAFGGALALPSANTSGKPSPKDADTVLCDLGAKIELILDGPCAIGKDSTIVDLSVTPPQLIRMGALSIPQLLSGQDMKIIGITGGTGSGKTTALKWLQGQGAHVIDCDAVYHDILENSAEMKAELESRFPEAVTAQGIERKKLGELVFKDKAALEELNQITHKYVGAEVSRQIAAERKNGRLITAVDAIALLESGLGESCDFTVGVIAPADVRVRRLMAREGISEEYARMRISAQKPDEFFRESCTVILENTGGPEAIADFEKNCERLLGGALLMNITD